MILLHVLDACDDKIILNVTMVSKLRAAKSMGCLEPQSVDQLLTAVARPECYSSRFG